MKRFLGLSAFGAIASLVLAHGDDALQSCSAPVLSELTIAFSDFAMLVVLGLAGLAFAGWSHHAKKPKTWMALGILVTAACAGYYLFFTPGFNPQTGFFVKDAHDHADLKVFLYGTAVNFSQDRFQSSEEHALSEFIHFHDGNGNVIHKHAYGVPLSYLFHTFNATLNASCIGIDSMLCSNATDTLKFYVNGKRQADPGAYEVRDLDRVLISFGPANQDVSAQLSAVTSEACISSNKCPVPPGYDIQNETCISS